MAALENESADPNPATWWQSKHGGEPSYSDVLKQLAPTPAERRRLVAGWIEPMADDISNGRKRPTQAHKAIAAMAARGFVRVIVTTNFDRLIEQALSEVGIEPTVISSADDAKGAEPLVHTRVTVIKVHGDYLDTRIKNTESELAKLDSGISKTLDRVFDEFGLIICGWSGVWDEGLRSAINRAPNRRYPTYWLHRSSLDEVAADVLKARKGKSVSIKDADDAFQKIETYISALETLRAPAPGDVNMLEAVAKKFLVDEKHRISLHDLAIEEARRVRLALLDESLFPMDLTPTKEVVRKRFEVLANISARIRRLIFTLCYYGRPTNLDVLRAFFQQLGAAPTRHVGYDVYRDLECLPIAFATYSATIASLLANRYDLLASVLNMRFRRNDGERDLVGIGAAHATGLADSLNPIGDQKYHAPFSHLTRPMFALEAERVGVIGGDFDAAFDKAEVLHCMVHGVFRLPQSSYFWGPVGDFGWKQRSHGYAPVKEWLDAGVAAGANWPPIKAGLFEGKIETFEAALAGYSVLLSEVRWF